MLFNSITSRNLKHFRNPKNEKMLKSPIFYGKNEFLVEMCISQLITVIPRLMRSAWQLKDRIR